MMVALHILKANKLHECSVHCCSSRVAAGHVYRCSHCRGFCREESRAEFKLQRTWKVDTQGLGGAAGSVQTEQGRCWLESECADEVWFSFVLHLQTAPGLFSLTHSHGNK